MSGDDDARDSDADGVRVDGGGADGVDADGTANAEADEDAGWRFGLDEVGEEAGPPPMEPESPHPEHVLFVLVGVVLTVVLLVGAV